LSQVGLDAEEQIVLECEGSHVHYHQLQHMLQNETYVTTLSIHHTNTDSDSDSERFIHNKET
jgi:hypothetical protein